MSYVVSFLLVLSGVSALDSDAKLRGCLGDSSGVTARHKKAPAQQGVTGQG
jgi:hypothetical protein